MTEGPTSAFNRPFIRPSRLTVRINYHWTGLVWGLRFPGPLPDVAMHVEEAKRVRKLLTDRMRMAVRVIAVPAEVTQPHRIISERER